ncbi:DUF262 domain-containing protein [Lacticaseibacillus yichunensis]|uniref:DUF262 domain-containing protein n=1 Tax=Lacticaseibacillus yichunensis TaxID=2486015 RepID=A0ABW4CMI1_9LACO|nr:DUF262 domain-containing protein [Lacticaseibacillus yichunensis]
MRLNERKLKTYNFDPTNSKMSRSIRDLNQYISDGVLSLPQYQRDISWNTKKMVALLNYQLFGKAPISPLSLNEILDKEAATPQISLIDRRPMTDDELARVKWSVIDGQQRLTTNYLAYTNAAGISNVVFDFGKATFVEAKIPTSNQIPAGILLNKNIEKLKKYLAGMPGYDPTRHYSYIIDIREKLSKYEYTLHIAEDMTQEEQLKWFEVLNNAGSRVSKLQLTFSRSKAYDFDIYTDYANKFKQLASDYGYGELFSPFSTSLSYPVALLNPAYEKSRATYHKMNYSPIPSDNKAGQLSKLDATQMRQLSDTTLNALKRVLDFLEDSGLQGHIKRMDYILYLTGYDVLVGVNNQNQVKLVDWVQNVDFTDKTSSERRKIFSDLLLL